MKPITQVRQVAQYFRKWAEENVNTHGFGWRNLTGMCAIASFEIFDTLRLAGFNVEYCANSKHAFVIVHESGIEYLVDVTATQFGRELPKVIVTKYEERPVNPKRRYFNYWLIESRTRTTEGVRNILSNWPTDQQPLQFQHHMTA